MPILSLDAAQTLVRTHWDPGRFAIDCAEACGLYLGESDAELYRSLLARRWKTYEQLNQTRDETIIDRFWLELTQSWLASIGEDAGRAAALMYEGNQLLYGPQSPYFSLFEDTLPALDLFRHLGIRCFVLSNWDNSLHRVLKSLGITPYFECVIASLEEGVEKPDTRLFEVAEQRMKASKEELVHVGDNPVDDVLGARNAGWRALLIDRSCERSDGNLIHTLLRVPEVLGWTL